MGTAAVVLGASGFGGGEVLRLLALHPEIEVVAAAASTRAGSAVHDVHPHLAAGPAFVSTEQALREPADVCFSCLPGGEFASFASEVDVPLVVDLSGDHRATTGWTYGLSEFVRAEIASASRIANPGCYPTGLLLCLLPFARAGAIEPPVIVDAMSGTSGAGRTARDELLLATASGTATAYGDVEHRHIAEMERALQSLGGLETTISFTPHLVPMPRGLLVTARARVTTDLTDEDVRALLEDAYAREAFVDAVAGWPGTKAVAGTNRALVAARVDPRTGWLIASAAIDNLGKGAAGQAVQNANIALGLEEDAGLRLVGLWP